MQVQGLEGAVAVFAQSGLSVALKGDGTVWHWGSTSLVWNQGDQQPRPPAQVAGLTGVVTVALRNGELFGDDISFLHPEPTRVPFFRR